MIFSTSLNMFKGQPVNIYTKSGLYVYGIIETVFEDSISLTSSKIIHENQGIAGKVELLDIDSIEVLLSSEAKILPNIDQII